MFEGGGEVSGDVLGDDLGGGKVGGFFQGVVFEPEDVEVDFVALDELFVGEGFEAVCFNSLMPIQGGRAVSALLQRRDAAATLLAVSLAKVQFTKSSRSLRLRVFS